MDVYIGLGLLAMGIVIVGFMMIDGWLKNRNANKTELSGLQDKTTDDLDFTLDDLVEGVGKSYVISSVSKDPGLSDFSDDRELKSLSEGEDVPFHLTSEKNASPIYKSAEQPEPIRKADPKTVEKTNQVLSAAHEKNRVMPANLLVLSVMAQKGNRFESYDLLQAISAAGMQYGEMNIFHYYQPTPVGKIALFSLASANKPGDFDLNNIAEFSCSGLMLFMDISQTPDPQSSFKLMLDTADRLAEDLDGGLCSDPLTPWNEKLAWQYHQKIMQYKTASRHEHKTLT